MAQRGRAPVVSRDRADTDRGRGSRDGHEPRAKEIRLTYAKRATFATFSAGLLVTAGLMMLSGMRSRHLDVGSSERTEALGLVFFTSTREAVEGGTSFSLSPGPGVLVLLVVLPAAAFLVGWRKDRGSAIPGGLDGRST